VWKVSKDVEVTVNQLIVGSIHTAGANKKQMLSYFSGLFFYGVYQIRVQLGSNFASIFNNVLWLFIKTV